MKPFAILFTFSLVLTAFGKDPVLLHTFEKKQLTDTFYCEGAHYGDFNKDGKTDVVSGPFWYAGPEFESKHAYRPVKAYDPKNYSDNFLTYVGDFNKDGWDDIFIVGWPGFKPGHEHSWYENPKGKSVEWSKHLAFKAVDNESPVLGDLTGDGEPELVFHTLGRLGWAAPDPKNPTAPWVFHPLSENLGLQRYTHGLGFGDINGDGRADVMTAKGWWEQPEKLDGDPLWKRHDVPFCGGRGGAQMYAYDVDGDGDQDVITSLDGHGFGLVWHEQVEKDGGIGFKQHLIMGAKPEDNAFGVKFSQLHAVALVDIDGDGLKDIVTGKRYWAHGPKGDAEPGAPAVLYWFKLDRLKGGVEFTPYRIDDDSGVGTQVTAGDVNNDGLVDVVVGNKKGTFVFLHKTRKVSPAEYRAAIPKRLD